MPRQSDIQDPLTQYPQMEIPNQSQPEPGLDSKLKPLADHGVKTYQGTDRLKGRKALITGGDSGIGRAGQPAELAGAYVFLASQEASYISGEIIGVTGGQLR